jgi:hypothetical protein
MGLRATPHPGGSPMKRASPATPLMAAAEGYSRRLHPTVRRGVEAGRRPDHRQPPSGGSRDRPFG